MIIPDYLIYDEIKRRQERQQDRRDHLELPLYQPIPERRAPRHEDTPEDEDGHERGVTIIDMNDWLDDLDEDSEVSEAGG